MLPVDLASGWPKKTEEEISGKKKVAQRGWRWEVLVSHNWMRQLENFTKINYRTYKNRDPSTLQQINPQYLLA